jgi:tRNA (uracil-5-)-methyltransferase
MHLTERLGDCTFQISPGAFFQVNTEGAELLYQLAVDKVLEVSPDNPKQTLLFDVCCGTGTIGLTCMSKGAVGRVVGVDISIPAIKDAQANATLNGYNQNGTGTETRFVAARAEHVLDSEIRKACRVSTNRTSTVDVDGNSESNNSQPAITNFVAIVDPAREGLHSEVIRAIRGTEQIQRLIYVSCNPTGSLVNDAALLCTPSSKRYLGTPFKITSATPVDMFPLTNHCEMVMTFDRLSKDELKDSFT